MQIIAVVVVISVSYIHRLLFQLYKQQGNAIDKADDIRPAAAKLGTGDFQLLHSQKVIAFRLLKIYELHLSLSAFTIFVNIADINAVF